MSKPKQQKAKTDPYLVGFQYQNDKGKTPADFFADPETGLRPGMHSKPDGFAYISLKRGIYGSNIPPLGIWNEGFWLDEWDKVAPADAGKAPQPSSSFELRNLWVCSGEGTPSNYLWRIYEVPDQIATSQQARHPGMWSKKQKESGDKVESAWSLSKPPDAGVQTKASPIPYGVRFRCLGCGHWFKDSDLPTHMTNVCPGLNPDSLWGMMCDDKCGCENLHEAMEVKPGFPRTAKATEPEPKPAEEPDEAAEPEVAPV